MALKTGDEYVEEETRSLFRVISPLAGDEVNRFTQFHQTGMLNSHLVKKISEID